MQNIAIYLQLAWCVRMRNMSGQNYCEIFKKTFDSLLVNYSKTKKYDPKILRKKRKKKKHRFSSSCFTTSNTIIYIFTKKPERRYPYIDNYITLEARRVT